MTKFVNLSHRASLRLRALAATRGPSVGNPVFMRELEWMIDDVCHTARQRGIFGFECDRGVMYFYEEGVYVASFFIVPEWRIVRMFLLIMLDHESSSLGLDERTRPASAVSAIGLMSNTGLADADAA